jgi:ankyrin repeat protein
MQMNQDTQMNRNNKMNQGLPYELLLEILLQVDSFKTLKQICLSSKWVNELCKQNEKTLKANVLYKQYGDSIYHILTKIEEYGDDVELYKKLKQCGVDLHANDNRALYHSASSGHLEVVKYLVETGVDIRAKNDALHCGAVNGQLHVVKYLVENGADMHVGQDYLLPVIAELGHLAIVKFLVENGADVHAYEDEALRSSAKNGYLEVVKYLVETGVDIRTKNDALRESALNGHLDIVKYLLQNGAKSNLALCWSVKGRQLKLVQHLVKQGAKSSNKKVIEYLCEHNLS